MTVEYSTDLFLPASIERLLADYAVVLSGFVADPGCAADGTAVLAAAGREPAVVVAPASATADRCAGRVCGAGGARSRRRSR